MIENSDKIILRKPDEDYYLFKVDAGLAVMQPIKLNEVAGEMVKRLLEGMSIKEVARDIAAECGVNPSEVEPDIMDLLESLSDILKYKE